MLARIEAGECERSSIVGSLEKHAIGGPRRVVYLACFLLMPLYEFPLIRASRSVIG